MATLEIWTFAVTTPPNLDLTDFKVEARDGSVGKVDETSHEAGGSFIVVDTGPWIFGKKVMLPAGIVDGVDTRKERVYVERTRDEIKSAPEFDVKRYHDPEYRQELGMYYERIGMTRSGDRV